MEATNAKLQFLIAGPKQFLIPLFQRPYSWKKKQWKVLWDDIYELEPKKTHFMGAIVTMHAHTRPEGITKHLLIDGQQRLTTILILMIALRDKAKGNPGNLFDNIQENLLTNKFNENEDFYKLLPTQEDRESFINLIQEKPSPSRNKITEAYSFFSKQVANLTTKEEQDKFFNTVTGRLIFVCIGLERDDNAYLIFEGLNAKGLPLTQADLIRNYLLMGIDRSRQDKIFNAYWKPMQTDFKDDLLTEFIRHFLMRNASFVKKDEVYATMKDATDNYEEKETIAYLETLHRFSSYYQKLLSPETESNPNIRKRLVALKRLDVTTAYPFLLDLFDDLASKKYTDDEFVEILGILETFLVRRFVCSVPTHDLNKFFPSVLSQAKQHPSLAEGVADILAKRSFPRNAEFRRNLFSMKMYGGGERAVKTKLILERLEESFGHKEEVQAKDLTIEHVMPQTLTDWWKAHLGDNWEHVYERYVHTIGNLTLTGYNPALSNSSFEDKKKIYAASHVEITKSISGDKWTEQEIKNRIEQLYERAIVVWPNLGKAGNDAVEEEEEEPTEPVDTEGVESAITPAEVVEILGGGEPIKPTKYCFRLKDGAIIVVSVSTQYVKNKPYWYGLSPSFIKTIDTNKCSFVAFGMGSSLVALVPAEIVKTYIKHCGVSKYKTDVIHHYHFFITKAEPHELYGNQDSPRIVLTDYIKKRICLVETTPA